MIHVRLQGHPDGRPAVDYTVNAGVGIPDMTGPETSAARVNHVLPSWDLLMGVTATSGLLAAVHRRALTGRGARIDLALADVALSAVGSLGWLGEAEVEGDRPRQGNYVYGSFGTDFATADGQQVMLVALTARQWRALCQATETTAVFSALEVSLGANLDDEASRYQHRHTLAAILRPWFGRRTLGDIDETLSQTRVLWGPYRSMSQIVEMVGRGEASVIARIEQPGVGPILASSSPLRWNQQVSPPREAPLLGSDTESVLAEVLQLTQAEIGRLDRSGAISMSGPARPGIEKRSDPVVPATVETLKGT
jgi:2-methylfumaryl-CoA isomerase